jgi:dsRNA-specific ribonuclease
LLGDALLKTAVINELISDVEAEAIPLGVLTLRANAALANSRMAELSHVLLVRPGLLSSSDLDALPSDHVRATAVEAAAALVWQRDGNAAAAALRCVAVELLRGIDGQPEHIVPSKTRLMELGGKVESARMGGADHEQKWKATATLRGRAAQTGPHPSKRIAEALAAEQVLRAAGEVRDGA